MRISMVSQQASPLAVRGNTQGLHVAGLAAALCAQGHEVTVYSRRDDPAQPERMRAGAGYEMVCVPAGPEAELPADKVLAHMADFAGYLTREWESAPPDVVHAHFWSSGLAALLAARGTDLPVVQTFYGLGVVEARYEGSATGPAERVRLERLVGRNAVQVAAGCSDEVFELARLGLRRPRISIVPRGVEVDRFTPVGPRAGRDARQRILGVGCLAPRKGFATMISALPWVPETELVIAGGPALDGLAADPEAARLRELARRHGVADRVHLIGHIAREELPALYRSADLVVCTPWYEPFGLVPLEAMACGVPVVATAVGGLIDTVVDGVTGELVPPRRPDALAATLRRLLDEPAQREAYGIAGADRAHSRYSWDRVGTDMLRVYEQALGGRVPAPREPGQVPVGGTPLPS
ncbi:glycosyltransferase [Amycolatopsis sp.]|uniref:glycosyltransferase n=1 Tax=Amycolatopsis sp. TaxID=37632 RepID=UPI002C4EDA7E|nr:glycosyltransferase [Amycolatopsis sp.]HVV10340.1 glycosyltransferase [Amycolatopsis sp.]